jgi:hypothetical protein
VKSDQNRDVLPINQFGIFFIIPCPIQNLDIKVYTPSADATQTQPIQLMKRQTNKQKPYTVYSLQNHSYNAVHISTAHSVCSKFTQWSLIYPWREMRPQTAMQFADNISLRAIPAWRVFLPRQQNECKNASANFSIHVFRWDKFLLRVTFCSQLLEQQSAEQNTRI